VRKRFRQESSLAPRGTLALSISRAPEIHRKLVSARLVGDSRAPALHQLPSDLPKFHPFSHREGEWRQLVEKGCRRRLLWTRPNASPAPLSPAAAGTQKMKGRFQTRWLKSCFLNHRRSRQPSRIPT